MSKVKERFLELTRMKYEKQATWFMNGFFKELFSNETERENVWKYTHKFIELDKKEGNELDDFLAHKFLESTGQTLTVIALRETLRKIDLDANGKMALLEYLCFKYNKTVQDVIDSPPGANTAEVHEAAAKLQAVQDAMIEVTTQLQLQKEAEENQRKALAEQKKAEEEVKRAEDEVRKSEAELRKAVEDLASQENAYRTQLEELTKKSTAEGSSTVAKSKAAAELSQLKQEDPLPLRKAKLTQEAALRKVEKQRKEAEFSTQQALKRTAESEKLTELVKNKTKQVERLVRETEQKVFEAQAYLEEIKKKGGAALGAIFWMERSVKEAQKYLPKNKQTM